MHSSDFSDVPFGDLPVVECTGHASNDEGYGNSYDGAAVQALFDGFESEAPLVPSREAMS